MPRRIGIAKASPWAAYRQDIEAALSELSQSGMIRKIIEEQYFERFNIPQDAVTLVW